MKQGWLVLFFLTLFAVSSSAEESKRKPLKIFTHISELVEGYLDKKDDVRNQIIEGTKEKCDELVKEFEAFAETPEGKPFADRIELEIALIQYGYRSEVDLDSEPKSLKRAIKKYNTLHVRTAKRHSRDLSEAAKEVRKAILEKTKQARDEDNSELKEAIEIEGELFEALSDDDSGIKFADWVPRNELEKKEEEIDRKHSILSIKGFDTGSGKWFQLGYNKSWGGESYYYNYRSARKLMQNYIEARSKKKSELSDFDVFYEPNGTPRYQLVIFWDYR